jgi:hypothetical protein
LARRLHAQPEPLDEVELKGKTSPVKAYELISLGQTSAGSRGSFG